MSFIVESASLEPKSGSKFITGGEDKWVQVYDFFTGEEIGKSVIIFNHLIPARLKHRCSYALPKQEH